MATFNDNSNYDFTSFKGGTIPGGTIPSTFNQPKIPSPPDSQGGTLNIPGSNLPAPVLGQSLAPLGGSTTPTNTPGGRQTLASLQRVNPDGTPKAADPNAGLRDMSGQTWGAMNTVIPQGWFMDGQGQWIFKGEQANTSLPGSDIPEGSIANPSFSFLAANPGYVSGYPTGGSQAAWDVIYGGGQAGAPGTNNAAVTNPAGLNTQQNQQSNTNYLQQLIQGLAAQQAGPQYNKVKTPLGYTQYQSSVPQGSPNDALIKMLLDSLAGKSNSGGSQNSFWDLLSGMNPGGNSGAPGANAAYNASTGLPSNF